MKKFILIAALMIASVAAFAQSGKSIYQKYSDCEKVSAVYISPAMFKLIGQIPDLEIEDENINLAPVIKSLKGLYLISSENPDIRESVVKDVEKFIYSDEYELLMEAKDEGETVRIYTIGNEQTVKGFVMLALDPGELTFPADFQQRSGKFCPSFCGRDPAGSLIKACQRAVSALPGVPIAGNVEFSAACQVERDKTDRENLAHLLATP